MSDELWQVCAVCGYPLDHDGSAAPGKQWIHIRPEDHPAVPVDATEIQFNSRCDFCDIDGPTQMVLANSFMMSNGVSRSIGPWTACDLCFDLVKRGRWSQLITRVKQQGGPQARRVTRSTLIDMYEALRPNIVGFTTREEWLARRDYPFPSS